MVNPILLGFLFHVIHMPNVFISLYLLASGANGIMRGLESFPPPDDQQSFLPLDD